MHKAGKVIFRITNGSAFFFVLETFTPNVNGFIWTLKTVMLQDETSDGVKSHVHTAARSFQIQIH